MTERDIQSALYQYTLDDLKHEFATQNATNILLYVGESDFISVTRSGLIHEFEIKISRSDFRADFKKPRHNHLSGKGLTRTRTIERRFHPKTRWLINCVETYQFTSSSIPNYFTFVVPDGMISIDDVPEYCGLIFASVVEQTETRPAQILLKQVKSPTRFHARKINENQIRQMLRSQSHRVNRFMMNDFFRRRNNDQNKQE